MAAYARHGRQASARSRSRFGRFLARRLLQNQVAGGKRIRRSQRTHRDVLRSPVADSRETTASLERGRAGSAPGSQIELSSVHSVGDRADARSACGGDSQRGDLGFRPPRQSGRCRGSAGRGPRKAFRLARHSVPPAGRRAWSRLEPKRAGPGSPAPSVRMPSNAPGTRKPATSAAQWPANRSSAERCEAMTSGRALKSKRFLSRDMISGNAGTSEVADLNGQRMAARDRLDLQPAAVFSHRYGSQISLIDHLLDSRRGSARQKIEAANARQAADDRRASRRTDRPCRCPQTPQVARREPVVRPKQGIEPPDAVETAREGNLDNGQARLREQLLRQQQPLRLRQLDRGNAELLLDARLSCRALNPRSPASSSRLPPSFRAPASIRHAAASGRAPDRVHRSMPGRQLGPAAQARPKPITFGQRRVRIEAAAIAPGTARRADRPAVNPRRRHPHEEKSVETSVSRSQRPVANLVVNLHGLSARCLVRVRSV